jgi:hypothetical protein
MRFSLGHPAAAMPALQLKKEQKEHKKRTES